VVFVVSYTVARTLAKTAYDPTLIPATDETYEHLLNGDHMILDMYGERFHYAPAFHEPVAS
jgi:hypothetical protein